MLTFGSGLFSLLFESELLTESAQVDYVDSGEKNAIIYLLDRDYGIQRHGFTKGIVDYQRLRALKKGDRITVVHPKTKWSSDFLNYYLSGNIVPFALSNKQYGGILSYKTFMSHRKSFFRQLLVYVLCTPALLLCLVILYSWWLSLLFLIDPKKYENLETHLLMQHKIQQETP